MISSMLLYLLKVTVCLVVLHFFYRRYFHRLSFLGWNRFFMLSVIAISIVIPFATLPFRIVQPDLGRQISESLLVFDPLRKEALLEVEKLPETTPESVIFSFLTIFFAGVYLVGVLLRFFLFLKQMLKVRKIAHKATKKKEIGYTILKTQEQLPAFSFFRLLFLNQNFFLLTKAEQQQVVEHEKTHARQFHSFDILLFEILSIFLWFNPLNRQIKASILETHEYIADFFAVQKSNYRDYTRLILKLATSKQNVDLVNNFAKVQLKNRILMLARTTPEEMRHLRFFFTLPLLGILLMVFTGLNDIANSSKFLIKPTGGAAFVCPLENNYRLVQPFFDSKKIVDNNKQEYLVSHRALSFGATKDSPVRASAAGSVAKIIYHEFGSSGVAEYEIEIAHADGFVSRYKKVISPQVSEGEVVEKGQEIAKTGNPMFIHTFRFELSKDGKLVDPMLYF